MLKFRLFKKTTKIWRNLPVCRVKFKATGRFHQLLVAFLENLNFMDWTLMSLATPAKAAWLTCYLGLALPRFQLKTMGPSRQAQAGLAIETPGAPVAAAAGVSAAAAPGLVPPPPAPIVIGCHFARSVGGLLLWRRHVSVIALIELALKDEGVYFNLRGTFVAWNWAGLGPTVCWNGVLRGHFWWHYICKSRCEF